MGLTISAFVLVSAAVLTLFLMPLNIRAAHALAAIDNPDERRTHTDSTPRMGGLAIVLAFACTAFVYLDIDRSLSGLIAGGVIALLTGVADDIWQIRPMVKMAGQTLAALAFVVIGGVTIDNFGNLFGTGDLVTGAYAPYLTIFAIVSVMNALNLSD